MTRTLRKGMESHGMAGDATSVTDRAEATGRDRQERNGRVWHRLERSGTECPDACRGVANRPDWTGREWQDTKGTERTRSLGMARREWPEWFRRESNAWERSG